MKKECTYKKLVKDDKVTLISECNICKKNIRKELKLQIELAKLLIELDKNKLEIKPDIKEDERYRIDHFYELRSVFSVYTQEEIKKDPVLMMKSRLVLIDAIKQLDAL